MRFVSAPLKQNERLGTNAIVRWSSVPLQALLWALPDQVAAVQQQLIAI